MFSRNRHAKVLGGFGLAEAREALRGLTLDDVPRGVSVLAIGVFRLSRRLKSAVNHVVSGDSFVGLPTWRVLVGLSMVASASQKELVEFTRTEQPQLSRVLKTMEMRGLIVAVPDPDDLRSKIFSITESGRERHKKLLPEVARVTEAMDAALNEEEAELFLSMCERVGLACEEIEKERRNVVGVPAG